MSRKRNRFELAEEPVAYKASDVEVLDKKPSLSCDIRFKLLSEHIEIGKKSWFDPQITVKIEAGTHVQILQEQSAGYIVEIGAGGATYTMLLPKDAIR